MVQIWYEKCGNVAYLKKFDVLSGHLGAIGFGHLKIMLETLITNDEVAERVVKLDFVKLATVVCPIDRVANWHFVNERGD